MVLSSLRVHTLPSGNSMPLPTHLPVKDSPLPSFWSKSMKMDASSLAITALICHAVAVQVGFEKAKFVTGFSRWVKGQAQGLEPGGFKLWVNCIQVVQRPPHHGLIFPCSMAVASFFCAQGSRFHVTIV
jgi:hypothetical protein